MTPCANTASASASSAEEDAGEVVDLIFDARAQQTLPTRSPGKDLCAGRGTVAEGSSPLIDDMEDGDALPIIADGRAGGWWVAHDPTCPTQPSTDAPPRPVKPEPGNPSRYAMHVSARDCPSGNAAWGFQIDVAFNLRGVSCAYDVSAYRGIQFWARGNVELGVAVAMTSSAPMDSGGDGTCDLHGTVDKGCWDHYRIRFTLTNDWRLYHFEWVELRQRGFGVGVPWDPKKATGLDFQVDEAQTQRGRAAEFSLDNIAFVRDAPDTRPIGASNKPAGVEPRDRSVR